MVAGRSSDEPGNRRPWPPLRLAAWTALFIAILGWSSLLQPPPQAEVLPWTGTVLA
ncbi:MAG TPA: hypothetical protein VL460_07185 [Caulobacteraceae bacterium]|jgi:hypothetical protein|nr:hypothetical protein [Caulobacteraceae bacterium]